MNDQIINYKSCFIGPRSENKEILSNLIKNSIISALDAREKNNDNESFYETDYFKSEDHIFTINVISEITKKINNYLKKSIQFSSLKYQAHMIGDNLIPAIIGHMSILYNQNSVQPQFSNKVSFLEFTVCNDLNKMVGFDISNISKNINDFSLTPPSKDKEKLLILKEIDIIKPFSHLTTGGTSSNIESMMSSFFVKCIPMAIKNAILNGEFKNEYLKIKLFSGDEKTIVDLTNWELMNIDSDIIVKIPFTISILNDIPLNIVISKIIKYHVKSLGILDFCFNNKIKPPIFIAPSTIHYSISKSSSLLGIGVNNIKLINVDELGRMDINHLKETLEYCNENNISVISLIVLIGSTQEGGVDNLEEILKIRDKFRFIHNFNFNIHIDGAYGGYFLSVINENDDPLENPPDEIIFNNENNRIFKPKVSYDPLLIFNQYLIKQFKCAKFADTISLDGHKTGYIPYNCGVLCYRNSKFKDISAVAGEYIGGTNITSMGIYGIEGSRAGTSAVSLYFAHSIIRPSKLGYGLLLSKCLLNSKLLYFKLLHFAELNKDKINITFTCNQMDNSRYNYLKSILIDSNNDLIDINEIESKQDILNELSNIGSDLTVLCFAFNLVFDNKINQNLDIFLNLNNKLIQQFSPFHDDEIILSSTKFTNTHGPIFFTNLINSIGFKNIKPQDLSLPFLRLVIMNPFLSELVNGSFINQMVKIIEIKVLKTIKEFQ